jgi:hypothetical protein
LEQEKQLSFASINGLKKKQSSCSNNELANGYQIIFPFEKNQSIMSNQAKTQIGEQMH